MSPAIYFLGKIKKNILKSLKQLLAVMTELVPLNKKTTHDWFQSLKIHESSSVDEKSEHIQKKSEKKVKKRVLWKVRKHTFVFFLTFGNNRMKTLDQ